jgi:hypothetical protein
MARREETAAMRGSKSICESGGRKLPAMNIDAAVSGSRTVLPS